MNELLGRFAETEEFVRLFAYLPDGTGAEQNELLRFLIEGHRDYGSLPILIVPKNLLCGGIMEHPYLQVLSQIVIEMDSGAALTPNEISVLEACSKKACERQCPLTVWMDAETNGQRVNTLVNLFRAARAGGELQMAEFRIGVGEAKDTGDRYSLPDEWLDAFPACRLYENTLTIDPDGRVVPCPRHHGAAVHPDLGSLTGESLEALLIKKGRLSLGSMQRCRSCRLKGRLYWPESRTEYSLGLMAASLEGVESQPGGSIDWMLAMRRDISSLSETDFDRVLQEFEQRVRKSSAAAANADGDDSKAPVVSIETPVIKAGWLLPCIESVLNQSSTRWQFSLLWDRGDGRSKRILEMLARVNHPRISVYFGDGLGVARARKFLTERTAAKYILPLDDDDVLSPEAVERFLEVARANPWSGIIRARRDLIDESGSPVAMKDWFPFGPRQYQRGMTRDLYNHSQPYLISRSAYDRTAGWEGFEEYRFAGEDCDIFAKIEEVAEVELMDEVLYSYRLSDRRTSHELGTPAAEDMWRRLAVNTLRRRGLPLELANAEQPFEYGQTPSGESGTGDWELLIITSEWRDGAARSDPREEWSVKTGISVDAIHVLTSDQDFSKAMASAIRQSARKYVWLMRAAPCEDSRRAIQDLTTQLEAHDADLAGPKTLDLSGRLISADPYFDSQLMPATSGWLQSDCERFDYQADASWLPATMLVVRRHVFLSIGAFDPALTGRLQDADFCLRARSRGFRCVYVGNVTVHVPGVELADTPAAAKRRFQDRWKRFPELLFPEQVIPRRRGHVG